MRHITISWVSCKGPWDFLVNVVLEATLKPQSAFPPLKMLLPVVNNFVATYLVVNQVKCGSLLSFSEVMVAIKRQRHIIWIASS